MTATPEERRTLESLDRAALERHQLQRLNALLGEILPANRFCAEKLDGLRLPIDSLEQLAALPLTCKDELVDASSSSAPPANLTWPLERYVRFHQTSGTHGRPLAVYDTAEDWQWWVETWQYVLDAAEIDADDRAFMAFSFGPFIGFWSAYDALVSRGAMVIPGGGMDTLARIELMRNARANVLCSTPSYALHLAEIARDNQIGDVLIGDAVGDHIDPHVWIDLAASLREHFHLETGLVRDRHVLAIDVVQLVAAAIGEHQMFRPGSYKQLDDRAAGGAATRDQDSRASQAPLRIGGNEAGVA